MADNAELAQRLLDQAGAGDPQALGALLEMYHSRLQTIIEFRMDWRLRGRLDAVDVLQEGFLEATERFSSYYRQQEMPFFLWLRFIVVQKLQQLHRQHLGVQARDAGREVSIFGAPQPQATSAVIAAHLLGKQTSPSAAAVRNETRQQVEEALNTMEAVDREVLVFRHFEQLSNREVALLLNLSDTAANNRYMRALKRLKQAIEAAKGE